MIPTTRASARFSTEPQPHKCLNTDIPNSNPQKRYFMNDQLLAYVQRAHELGASRGDVEAQLQQAGWTGDLITQVSNQVYNEVPKKADYTKWIVITSCVAVMIVSSLFVLNMIKSNSTTAMEVLVEEVSQDTQAQTNLELDTPNLDSLNNERAQEGQAGESTVFSNTPELASQPSDEQMTLVANTESNAFEETSTLNIEQSETLEQDNTTTHQDPISPSASQMETTESKNPPNAQETTYEEQESTTQMQQFQIPIAEIVKLTTATGETDVQITSSCGGGDCFAQKFKVCEPADGTATTNGNTYFSQIIGPRNGGCQVNSKVQSHPNPQWIGKEMSCIYDNTKEFNVAVQDMSRCEGELLLLFIQAQLEGT